MKKEILSYAEVMTAPAYIAQPYEILEKIRTEAKGKQERVFNSFLSKTRVKITLPNQEN